MANRSSVLNIIAMHHSERLREELAEGQAYRIASMRFLPKPPQGHPWQIANAEARKLGGMVKGDYQKFCTVQVFTDRLWAEWKAFYRRKFNKIRSHIGESAWAIFWEELPSGEAMIEVIERALAQVHLVVDDEIAEAEARLDEIEEDLLAAEKVGPEFFQLIRPSLFNEMLSIADVLYPLGGE